MATDYGGGYGGQPWHDRQLPYAGPAYGAPADLGLPLAQPPTGPSRQPRSRVTVLIALTALLLGGLGFLASLAGVVIQVAPRQFTAAQAQQIRDWESASRWREFTAAKIFPATVTYAPPATLDDSQLRLTARRLGIARQAPCRAAVDAALAASLVRNHCQAMLRATYTDGTNSYLVTVGAAALPSEAAARATQRGLVAARTGTAGPAVHTVKFNGTPAAGFSNSLRQASGSITSGAYVVLYTIGYADPRPRQPVTGDSYGYAEMTSFGEGVARAVLTVLGAEPRTPTCPGAPGC